MKAPTNNPITQGKHGVYSAVDYSYLPDSYIYAPEDGTVTFYALAGDCGNNLQIQSGNRRHGFCHLEKSLVKVGQKVTKGQKVGVMGYTGLTIPKGPAGRHLHWVIETGGKYIYPPSLINESFEEEVQMPTINDIDNAFNYLGVKDSDKPKDKDYGYYQARPDKVLYTNVLNVLYKKYKAEQAKSAGLTKQLKVAQVMNGDATKWQQLKVLLGIK